MTATINSAALIADRASSIEYWKRELVCLRKNQKALTKATKHVNTVFARHPDLTAYSWTSVSYWLDEGAVTLCMSVTHEVSSMKEGIAPAFMRSLLEAGFDVESTKDTATADSGHRTFEFKRPGTEAMVPMTLTFNAKLVNAPDATCRKVQTGVEVREVPTYQLVCEE